MVIDHCLALKNHNTKSSITSISNRYLEIVSVVSMLLMFFPREILDNIVLVEMNYNNCQKEELEVVSFEEFLRLNGIWIFPAVSGFRISKFWIIQKIDTFGGLPYCFHGWVYLWCFEAILRNIYYTDRQQSTGIKGSFLGSSPVY